MIYNINTAPEFPHLKDMISLPSSSGIASPIRTALLEAQLVVEGCREFRSHVSDYKYFACTQLCQVFILIANTSWINAIADCQQIQNSKFDEIKRPIS
jgi:hypothetical protein